MKHCNEQPLRRFKKRDVTLISMSQKEVCWLLHGEQSRCGRLPQKSRKSVLLTVTRKMPVQVGIK